MITFAQLMTEHEQALIDAHGHELLPSHRKAISAMKRCRTGGSLLMVADCEQWLERQRAKLLPVDYFMITFTLPAQLRTMAWLNQRVVFNLLFSLAWETLRSFGLSDPKLLGKIGATAVLHTNTRALDFHPHVHFVVPAGAVDKKHRLWRQKEGKFLFHQKSSAKVFHAKWIEAIKESKLSVKETIPRQWVVNCQHVGLGNSALTYLGKYLYRGVLPEKQIIRNENGKVTFAYKDNRGVRRTREMAGGDFLWLILKHVLPRGFRRSRDYGFLHGNSKKMIQLLHYVLRCIPSSIKMGTIEVLSKRAAIICEKCGAAMRVIATRLSPETNLLPLVVDT